MGVIEVKCHLAICIGLHVETAFFIENLLIIEPYTYLAVLFVDVINDAIE
jgi:hypothetical protein